MQRTLSEIAKYIDGEVAGDGHLVIKGIHGIKNAGPGDLTFIDNPKYATFAQDTKASAIITPRTMTVAGKSIIRTDNPSLAFAKAASLFFDETPPVLKGIHKTAVIGEGVDFGKHVAIGPYAVIEDQVSIGDATIIQAGSYIGYKTRLGRHCLIYPHTTIRERVVMGDRVVIHSGTVIGCDGFGYTLVKGAHEKIPQIGTVVIEDDVEIGSNVTIDRARFERTVIGKGTKIDNLVQVAHNVIIGKHCLIISQVGISGSVIIEDYAVLAGQAGIAGHLTIGEGATIAAQAGVSKSVPPKTIMLGYPARPYGETMRINACVQNLPKHVKIIGQLKKRVEELEEKLKSIKKMDS